MLMKDQPGRPPLLLLPCQPCHPWGSCVSPGLLQIQPLLTTGMVESVHPEAFSVPCKHPGPSSG